MAETYVAAVSAGGAVLGALVGALAAGLMALKTARVQAESSHLSQARDLQEQHRVRHREISRTAYGDFIDKTAATMRALHDLSNYEVADVDVMLSKAEAANVALFAVAKSMTNVELEGERDAVNAAEEYRASLDDVLATVASAELMQRAATSGASIREVDPERVGQIFSEAKLRRGEFMACARRALGNDSV
ncbi:hypothetical protein AB0952_21615 [Streptomyces caniferus]|uniref:hypothetical protein n=1 Tax=Streptomyces caniferus TaxID=285557 RepID=UPI0034567D01